MSARPPALERLLVATDFSVTARLALERGLELAAELSARVEIIHAWTALPIMPPAGAGARESLFAADFASITEQIHDEHRRALAALAAELAGRGVGSVPTQLVLGDPREVIVHASAGHDLVVMGTHGLSGLPRLLLGSVAEYVVRHARCPVMTVRGPHVARAVR